MTEAFLALPIFFPGTGLWKGYQGRCYIIKVLSVAAARSKKRMAAGHEPECLLDFWAQQVSVRPSRLCVRPRNGRGRPPPKRASRRVAMLCSRVPPSVACSRPGAPLAWSRPT